MCTTVLSQVLGQSVSNVVDRLGLLQGGRPGWVPKKAPHYDLVVSPLVPYLLFNLLVDQGHLHATLN